KPSKKFWRGETEMNQLSAPEKKDQMEVNLESKLHGHLDYALTTLGRDLAEVIDRFVREGESLARIAYVRGRATQPVGDELSLGLGLAHGGDFFYRAVGQRHRRRVDDRRPHASCVERQVDVAFARVPVVDILRERLVEEIEEPEAELESLRLCDLEVLEQRDVPVLATRRAEVEGRGCWP